MAVNITFNGYTIQGVQDWREQGHSRINESVIPRKDGIECEDYPSLDGRAIILNGVLSSDSTATTMGYLDDLKQIVNYGAGALTLLDDSRSITAVKRNFDFKWDRTGRVVNYNIEFLAKSSLWSATAANSDTGNTTSPFTITPGGNAYTYPTFTITVSGSTITTIALVNNHTSVDSNFTYSANVAVGTSLVVNCSAKTVVNASTSDLTNFTGDFWPLVGGEANSIGVIKSGGSYSIAVTWFDRWY